MELAAISRPLNVAPAKSVLEKPVAAPFSRPTLKRNMNCQVPLKCERLIFPSRRLSLSHVKASNTTPISSSEDADTLKSTLEGLLPKKSTFPSGFEALVLDVCDVTDVAELKLKVGDFEIHVKRDIGTLETSPQVTPVIASSPSSPPAPSKKNVESSPSANTPQKSTAAVTNPFTNVTAKATKVATLEAMGVDTYVIISSPTVGVFRSGRTVKGKKQPPSCKEGDMIKEGQIIGFLDQFGSELPVRADASGEALKILFKDGEPVGYGDPLVAILPSFHGIK